MRNNSTEGSDRMAVKDKPYYKLMTIMKMKGVTQLELAELIEVNRSSISNKLNGITALRFSEAEKIAKHLGITMEDMR